MIQEVTSQKEFEQTLQQNKAVIYYFFATWCHTCKAIASQVQILAKENTNVKVFKLDIDKVPSVATSQSIYIKPTFKLYKNGSFSEVVVGPNIFSVKALFTK